MLHEMPHRYDRLLDMPRTPPPPCPASVRPPAPGPGLQHTGYATNRPLRDADNARAPAPQQGRGRPKGSIRQQIEALLQEHPAGLTAEQLRGYLAPGRPIGDVLAGMRRTQAVRTQRHGREVRYFLV